ncbi:hypothetical protein [Pseudomonas phage vB_PaeM_RP7]|uniref:Uncharacterized protein n=1 Tax=Pseudomonas phage PAP-JP TaxID=2583508 RepID=A0A5C1K5E5_9CAUD|nr:hypothetical protein PAPJP_076 [Pseudomonas phage PAP-JP]WAB56828.1 hypothetical protein [Pseudomonas phage vB_PaeM_RP15]WAB56942.1 hypothetical protein [Pseudomonas phage vB_PaeM_RP6]WAB57149.1 hypothetical protein [Pseudomonas phage vB_PaeM_RP7]WAB57286.1 hypothetical protein [Pseudomonas phage vB_PaeM_RP8]WAB57454.1 hypothetical protein [Pseudomonas phage vB_PaeM_RP9]WAB57569.1 hypothetical protein [Pseudomonas phage vB_PaeM_RP10]WAB57858.1 hypothetical protein [Pseudomonas phage vB_Pa
MQDLYSQHRAAVKNLIREGRKLKATYVMTIYMEGFRPKLEDPEDFEVANLTLGKTYDVITEGLYKDNSFLVVDDKGWDHLFSLDILPEEGGSTRFDVFDHFVFDVEGPL